MVKPLSDREIRLARALEWAMPYAEAEHERSNPGETYAKDGYVADSVRLAREALEEVENIIRIKSDKPEQGKIYRLTGGKDVKSIAGGAAWSECEVETE